MLQRLAVMPSMFGVLSPCCIGNEWTAFRLHDLSDTSVLLGAGTPGVTNTTVYVPLTVSETITIVKGWWLNAGTVSGNVDIGLYPEAGGAKLVSLGSTAQAGTNVLQEGNIADTVVPPGRYLMAFGWSSATATFECLGIADMIKTATLKSMGVAMEAAFALPASATPIAFTSAGVPAIPVFGFSQRTLVA